MIQKMFATVDIKKTNYKNVGKINHGDDLLLEIRVLSDGDTLSFNNPMVDLLVKKSDGKMVRQTSGIELIKPNIFVIEVSKDCVTSPGLTTNQLIINDDGRVSTCMFYYTVLNSLEEDVMPSISNVEVLEQLDEFVVQIQDVMEVFDSDLAERMDELVDGIVELEKNFNDTSSTLNEAEVKRSEAEQLRAQAEALRVQNEDKRAESENVRVQNESDRDAAELVREQREVERVLNDEERHRNESERVMNEELRQQNESTRQSNESVRISNENNRKTQENRRVTAETNRVNAETTRRNNENSRISNEIERQKTMNEMKSLIGNVAVIEDEIEEINSSLDNITNRVTNIENNGTIDGVIDERVGDIEDDIEEINSSLDNITNRVEYIENNGIGGGSLNLRDVLDGEIFTIDIPTTPTVTYGQIVVNKSSATITEGSTDTFTVKLDKAPTNNQVVTLNKNNSDVTLSSYSLTFTPSNYSTAQTVTITVAEDNADYSDETCNITLSSPNVSTKTLIVNITDNDEKPSSNIPVSSVSLDRSSHELEVGQTIQLTATVLPNNATNKSVTWSASNSNCTVNNGLVEAISSGSCVITCATVDGNKTASCNITILVEPEEPSANYTNYIYNSDTYVNPTDITQHAIKPGNASIYWQTYKSRKTVSNGVATVLFNDTNGFFQCRPFTGDGKTYYCSYLVDSASSDNVNCIISSVDAKYKKDLGNGWTLCASVVVDSNYDFTIKIIDKRTSDWTPIQTKEWMKICLTDLYPDGNYPSIEECSNLFKYVSGIKG